MKDHYVPEKLAYVEYELMKFLLLISIFISAFSAVIAQSQQVSPCPKISITTDLAGYPEREQSYRIYASIDGYDWENSKYKWTLTNNLPFEGQGKPYIYFVTKDEMNGLNVTVSLEIEGLPANCENKASNSFKILYNPGTPVDIPFAISEYRELSLSKEKKELDNIIAEFKKFQDFKAHFIIHYSEKDSKQSIRNRILRISTYLTQKHKLSKENFYFIIGGMWRSKTEVILAPGKLGSKDTTWEEDIEKLDLLSSKKALRKKNKQK